MARLTATIAQMAMVIVIGWQVYDIARHTMDPKAAALRLGIIGLVQFAPLFLLTLVTGWTADRIDRRWIARASVSLELLCAVALAAFAWTHTTTLEVLYVVAALLGVARAFAGPALGALAPNLVPREILPKAIALSSIAWQSGAIAGPAVGGYLYALAPNAPYTASAMLFLVSLSGLLLIPKVASTRASTKVHPWHQMIEGLKYVRHNRLVLGAISLDLFAVLLGGATAMLPVYARDVLHAGPAGLGHLRAAPAVGATLTAAFFAIRPLKTEVGLKMLIAVGVFGGATIVFGLSRWMPLSLACLTLLGAADMFSVYVRQSLIQLYTPDEMRGRVGAVSSLFISASNELGEAESGFLAALIGPVAAVVAGGIGAIAVVSIWARKFPELRLAKSFEPPDLPGAPEQEKA
jgi:MFS family permease